MAKEYLALAKIDIFLRKHYSFEEFSAVDPE